MVTGWCHLSVNEGELGIFNSGEADHFQIGNMLYDNPALKAAADKKEIETVFIVEKYLMTATQSPWSLETIGLIQYFSYRYSILLEMYKPSEVKNLITNDVIKRAGLWVPGTRHAMDSVRLALYHLIIRKRLLTECLKST